MEAKDIYIEKLQAVKKDTDTRLVQIHARSSKLESAESEAKMKQYPNSPTWKNCLNPVRTLLQYFAVEILEMKKPLTIVSETRMIESPSLEMSGKTEHGLHILEDQNVSTEVVIEKNEHDRIQNKKDTTVMYVVKYSKVLTFLKITT